ncbi:hypothetical protein Vretimale_11642 [Volvox reticuliferus]|uniref:YkgJ family cysteine cluster protein n=1 Tax=Volvox reticuliferus TaxID=1737510 RepID=A0A8J4GI36_9CHLO|nr:hypothetical protein Vretimale_11642 [Volvox reticuliferus]
MLEGCPNAYGGKRAAVCKRALTTAQRPCSAMVSWLCPHYRDAGNRTLNQRLRQQRPFLAMCLPGATTYDNAPEQPGRAGGSGSAGRIGGAGGSAAFLKKAVSPDPQPRDLSLEPFKALVAHRRFMCTMCGKCCTGDGEIWISLEEAARIARHVNMSLQRFLDGHTKQYSKYKGWRMLKTAEGSSSCIFLGQDNKCSIHAVRPSQCSTYPWWPELTLHREWEWEKANICEGFDHPEAGPLDVEEAAKQLKEANKMTQLRLLASEVADWADNVLLWDDELGVVEQLPAAKGKGKLKAQAPGGKGSGASSGGPAAATGQEMGANAG